MHITTRKPSAIAAELSEHISKSRSAFVPPNVTHGLNLAAEFMTATAERLAAAGLDTDPEPPAEAGADTQQPAA